MTVALLGTGLMGTGMAKNIAKAGIPLRVWNRSRERAEPLAEHGITIADSPAEAVEGADVVVTILFDLDAVESVMKDVTLSANAVWAQMSTVGLEGTARLAQLSDRFLDAPVLGTRQPAEQGKLLVLASGPAELRPAVSPVFDAIGSKTVWVGDEPGAASRLKLVLNSWVLSLMTSTAQSVAFAEGLGLDPKLFLESISGSASDSPLAHGKGSAIIARDFTPAFSLDGGEKDARLIVDAMRSAGVDASIVTAMGGMLRRAQELGHGDEDMAAVYHSFK
jgi:3-hydroxyisobutyrate dehydrogenase